MVEEVYLFDNVPKEKIEKGTLGGKGFGLVEMTALGLPVPPGIVITTHVCNEFFQKGRRIWPGLKEAVLLNVRALEKRAGKKFNDADAPLLVSVRSGAPLSMPGMMDTVLNLGINDRIVEALATKTGDERFAYDTYRRFVQLFGKIVMGVPGEKFDGILGKLKEETGAANDIGVTAEGWKDVVKRYKRLIKEETGHELPQDPFEQLLMSVGAIFNSWWNPRAREYRRIYKIPDTLGTAVSIVAMVYGNLDDDSGSGVAFTRDPSTGEKKLYGELLMKAQGEDVVAGIRTPLEVGGLKDRLPEAYRQLEEMADKLEHHFRDVQDIEFTIEAGKLYILQTRTGKRTPIAAVKIAVDMAGEGLISPEEAVLRVEPDALERLLYKQLDPKTKVDAIAKGMPASPGAAVGKVVFTVKEALRAKQRGEKVILVRPETTPEDIAGIAAADGVLTSRGGMTSHAAVVARGMGKPCVVGAESVRVSVDEGRFVVGELVVNGGDSITVDGGSGRVYLGEMPLVEPELTDQVATLLGWADQSRRLNVRANADTPAMAAKARENGAEGIGLVRTERMFNAPDRLALVQRMILAANLEEETKCLDLMKPMQKGDFKELFRIMRGLPVTIRLIDLPLHEFLPKIEEVLPEIFALRMSRKNPEMLKEKERILSRATTLKEYNPMMGQRGVRLGLANPEIYRMQVSAIFEAAAELLQETGNPPEIEVMISQVAEAEEVRKAREIIEKEASEVMKKYDVDLKYKVGCMIETPRAALTASSLAKYADFFSFGTNDLTQATFAFSRDDAEARFLPFYIENKVLDANPFETLDYDGVGQLVTMGAESGKMANPRLAVGVCGELGGDPRSIDFFNSTQVDYVSCSPYRLPVARLAAAQAELKKHHATSSTV